MSLRLKQNCSIFLSKTISAVKHNYFSVLAAGTRIGIVCAVLLILIIMVIGALIKLRFFAREHRLKLANNVSSSYP